MNGPDQVVITHMDVFGSVDAGPDDPLADVVAVVVDGHDMVTHWSQGAAELLDRTADEVCGRPLGHLFTTDGAPDDAARADSPAVLRHAHGRGVAVMCRLLRLQGASSRLLLALPADRGKQYEQGAALLRALLAQDRIGVVVRDVNLSLLWTNLTSALPPGSKLSGVMAAPDAASAEARLRTVLETGVPQVAEEQHVRSLSDPSREWSVSVSAVRTTDRSGRPSGVTALLTDATAQWLASRRLGLRHRAAVAVGHSLDPERIAQEVADVLVPDFADMVSVDLAEAVLTGDEPPFVRGGGNLQLRRAAVRATGRWPSGVLQPGMAVPPFPDLPGVRQLQEGQTVFVDRTRLEKGFAPDLASLIIPDSARHFAAAPLFARGLVLGAIVAWRTRREEPFRQQDADLLTEIAAQAALGVDNARRYTREHRAAVALQRRLLPPASARTAAVQTASKYLPAAGGAEIGGDWFDAIPLPSLRFAMVVGDVVGHGIHATATMGRLRAAVQTLADLELPPDEILTRLDDLVLRIAAEAAPAHRDTIGATCLVALYDPVTEECVIASAGHPPPLVTQPDGTTRPAPVDPGPPLGVGGLPFETTTVRLAADSWLAFYTDGLLDPSAADVDAAVRRLGDRIADQHRSGCSVGEAVRVLTAGHADLHAADDATLLLAHVRPLRADVVAEWTFPANPAAVADARSAALAKLAEWGLTDMDFAVELIVSELVTNAVRYAGGPIGLRLIRHAVLVCEVVDPSNTQPRLRRASTGDEGGRGLFLVAQLSSRWGSRYGLSGKTIWAELEMPG
ncbi:SpoIIE family protein phosphatase [Streptomyces sp. NPDC005496]|uniref:SpoIIE family protein phosphatase n=2 Tax=Streptomyces TaxID=1883 RepID=UPI0033BE7B48